MLRLGGYPEMWGFTRLGVPFLGPDDKGILLFGVYFRGHPEIAQVRAEELPGGGLRVWLL